MKHIIPTAFPDVMSSWLARLLGCFVIFEVARRYQVNPEGIGILIFIILVAIARIRTDRVIITSDWLIFERRYFFNLIKSTDKVEIDKIEAITISGNRNAFYAVISAMIPFQAIFYNTVTLSLPDDTTVSIDTLLYREQLTRLQGVDRESAPAVSQA